jgi:hypothetical protein
VPSLGDAVPAQNGKDLEAGGWGFVSLRPFVALNIYALNLDDHELPSAYLYKSNGTWKYTLRPDAL